MNVLILSLILGGSASDPWADSLDAYVAAASASNALVAPLQDEAAESFALSYTFIEIGATQYDVDEADEEADIYYLEASLALGMFHIIGSYENQDLDVDDTTADLITIGAGLHFSLTPKLDLEGDVRWLYTDVDSDLDDADGDSNGYQVRVGPRWMVAGWDRGGLEVDAHALWIDLEDSIYSEDEAFGWDVGARAHFLNWLSVGATYGMVEDDDQASINARFSL